MRFLRALIVVGLVGLAASVARADSTSCSTDFTIHPNTGGGGSPQIGSSGTVTFTSNGNGCASADLHVANGTVTEFTITVPLVDLTGTGFCSNPLNGGGSNSFFTTLPGAVAFNNGNGTATCTYFTVFTDPLPVTGDGSSTETLAQKQSDCMNKGILDADDCLGTPAGSDLLLTITGVTLGNGGTFVATYSAQGVPEPGSFTLLLFGLAGLPFVRRKLRA